MGDRLSEIRARLFAAPGGPWWVNRIDNEGGSINWQVQCGVDKDAPCLNTDDLFSRKARETADFVAHAPKDIAFLLRRVERLERDLAKLRGEIEQAAEDFFQDVYHPEHDSDGALYAHYMRLMDLLPGEEVPS